MNFSGRLRLALASFALIAFGAVAVGQQGNPGAQLAAPTTKGDCVKMGPGVGQIQGTGAACAAGYTASALTKTDDTNVTLTLSGTPATALLQAVGIQAGWTGTLAAGRLNSNVVQGVTNDTNITGSIAAQNLTFAWSGTLAAARLNSNVVQSIVNDTNVTGSISAQALTLGWAGTLGYSRGGCNAATQVACRNNIFPTAAAAGDIVYWNGSAWAIFSGNGSGNKILQEDASGVPSWVSAGSGTVTSAVIAGAGLTVNSGTCTITTTGTCTLTTTAATQADQETATSTTTVVTPGRQQFHPSAAKMYAVCTNSGGTYTLRQSFNISGGTCGKTATGTLTLTLSTAFSSSTAYGCVAQVTDTFAPISAQNFSASTVGIFIVNFAIVAQDASFAVVCYGDQ